MIMEQGLCLHPEFYPMWKKLINGGFGAYGSKIKWNHSIAFSWEAPNSFLCSYFTLFSSGLGTSQCLAGQTLYWGQMFCLLNLLLFTQPIKTKNIDSAI